jgi:hypothetical protein
MSDINLDFTVSNNSIDFTVQPNDITFVPADIQLNISTGVVRLAAGSNQQVQYNNAGSLEGSSQFIFDSDSSLMTVTNMSVTGNATMGTGGNVVITNGNISANTLTATTANIQNGTVNANSITSVYSNIGNVSNVRIGGGVNGYVLQTDGTGNLTWSAGGGSGNGVVGGTNTQIQYNDVGLFGGNAGFTFNEVSGNVAIPGSLAVTGNISGTNLTGTLTTSAQPNITSVGTLASLSVTGNSNTGNIYTSGASGNISGANVIFANTFSATGNITANYFLGNGSLLTGIIGVTSISNGNSNVNIATANGNVTVTAGGTTSLTVSNSNVTGRQFISNVANGTAPFVVTSTTTVANLRVANATYANSAGSANSAFSATTASNVSGTGNSIVGSLTANSYIVPLGNGSATLGYTGQRFANLFVGNIFFSGNLTGGASAPVAAVTTTPTNKLPIDIGGVTYYICLTTAV